MDPTIAADVLHLGIVKQLCGDIVCTHFDDRGSDDLVVRDQPSARPAARADGFRLVWSSVT
jgi:hypothetical protein